MKIKKLGVYFIVAMLMVSFVLSSISINAYAEETKKIGIGNLTEDDLVAAWYFDEDSGDVVKDYKGNFDGTANGTTIVDTPYGKGRSFDGVDDHIQFDDSVIPIGKKSIRFKFKRDSSPIQQYHEYVMMNTHSSINATYGFVTYLQEGSEGVMCFQILYNDGTWGKIVNTSNVCDNQWHDILYVNNGTTASVYVDNMITPVSTIDLEGKIEQQPDSNLYIGSKTDGHQNLLGELTNIEIYNEAYIPPSTILDIEAPNYKIPGGTEFETFTVIKSAGNIYAEDMNISYDANLFELVSAVPVDVNALKIYHEETATLGQARYIAASKGAENGLNGDSQILKLTFKAKNVDGTGDIAVASGLVANGDGTEITLACAGKTFTVTMQNLGDVNKDGKFSLGDLAIAGRLFASTSDTWGTYEPDIDANGNVEDVDLTTIVQSILANE